MKGFFSRYNKAIVALSGGIDSSYMLYLAIKYLGSNNLLAVTVCNSHVFAYEIENARKVADILDVAWKPVFAEMTEDFYRNDAKRCYYCKKSILKKLFEIKKEIGFDVIFDGTNYDDLKEYRPGMKALEEFSVVSPLKENKITKNDIMTDIKYTPLSNITFHTESCIATRIIEEHINESTLRIVELVEDELRTDYPSLRLRIKEKNIFPELKSGKRLEDIDVRYIFNKYYEIAYPEFFIEK
ncbi:MAG: hypothetical protein LDL10_06255 [Calditerrivibrio sp.]|nr:hypothetical protein [Calditerrivibrio sp.]